MRRTTLPRLGWMVGLGCAFVLLGSLCGCSWNDVLPRQLTTLQNADAVDRALRLCSLSEGGEPFHLVLEIGDRLSRSTNPAARSRSYSVGNGAARPVALQEMRARVEIFWLSAITYRVEIHSRDFNQVRIVNGPVTEEHNGGDFYPRWIENFVDAILDPVPQAAQLRKIPGTVPVGMESHACISNGSGGDEQRMRSPEETSVAQVCFQHAEPRIASGVDFTRSVWFDDFAPFGRQQIARTLVNSLPANALVHGQITMLEPLRQVDYSLLKAHEYTLPAQRIRTSLVAQGVAQAMLNTDQAVLPERGRRGSKDAMGMAAVRNVSFDSSASGGSVGQDSGDDVRTDAAAKSQMTVYIRTDKTGRVREAYRNSNDQFGLTDAQVARAMRLKFKPLLVDGVARQMEAPILLAR